MTSIIKNFFRKLFKRKQPKESNKQTASPTLPLYPHQSSTLVRRPPPAVTKRPTEVSGIYGVNNFITTETCEYTRPTPSFVASYKDITGSTPPSPYEKKARRVGFVLADRYHKGDGDVGVDLSQTLNRDGFVMDSPYSAGGNTTPPNTHNSAGYHRKSIRVVDEAHHDDESEHESSIVKEQEHQDPEQTEKEKTVEQTEQITVDTELGDDEKPDSAVSLRPLLYDSSDGISPEEYLDLCADDVSSDQNIRSSAHRNSPTKEADATSSKDSHLSFHYNPEDDTDEEAENEADKVAGASSSKDIHLSFHYDPDYDTDDEANNEADDEADPAGPTTPPNLSSAFDPYISDTDDEKTASTPSFANTLDAQFPLRANLAASTRVILTPKPKNNWQITQLLTVFEVCTPSLASIQHLSSTEKGAKGEGVSATDGRHPAFMSQASFDALPDWSDVEDDPEYNTDREDEVYGLVQEKGVGGVDGMLNEMAAGVESEEERRLKDEWEYENVFF